jgi:hypothetical protein
MHALTALASAGAETKEEQNQAQESSCIQVTNEVLRALEWSTGLKDRGMLLSLAVELHPALRDEQVRRHSEAKLPLTLNNTAEAKQVVVIPNQLASRMQVAKLYYQYLRSCGWKELEREPWGARQAFMTRLQWGSKTKLQKGRKRWEGGCVFSA